MGTCEDGLMNGDETDVDCGHTSKCGKCEFDDISGMVVDSETGEWVPVSGQFISIDGFISTWIVQPFMTVIVWIDDLIGGLFR